ncbi:MAG: helix-turn-helix domain-containing protein [Candidatus Sumerlaeia bacterium]
MSKKKEFNSAGEMLAYLTGDKSDQESVEKMVSKCRLVDALINTRCSQNISQADIARKTGWTQSKVSRIENSDDASLNWGDVLVYASCVGLRLNISLIPKKTEIVDRIKFHVISAIRELKELSKIAEEMQDYEETVRKINEFNGEVLLNFLIGHMESSFPVAKMMDLYNSTSEEKTEDTGPVSTKTDCKEEMINI